MCCFFGERKTVEPGENPSEQGENQQQIQPTYGTGPALKVQFFADILAFDPLTRLK